MRPDMLPPAGLGEDSSAGSKASTGRDRDKSSDEGDDIEIDGDATVLVAPSDLSGEGAKAK